MMNWNLDLFIYAWGDDDFAVASTAERIIRYLGNPKGIAVLPGWYQEQKEKLGSIFSSSNIIPVPLCDRDYQEIEDSINKSVDRWGESGLDDYIYPLALDDSDRAQEYLQKIIQKTAKLKRDGSIFLSYIDHIHNSQPRRLMKDAKDLGKVVLENAFFIENNTRGELSCKVLAKTVDDDKALIEVFLYYGPIATETYHVVIKREGRGWRYISVTLVSMS